MLAFGFTTNQDLNFKFKKLLSIEGISILIFSSFMKVKIYCIINKIIKMSKYNSNGYKIDDEKKIRLILYFYIV